MPDKTPEEAIDDMLRDLALAGLVSYRSSGTKPEVARQNVLESLSQAVNADEDLAQYRGAIQGAVDWAVQKMLEDKGSELRN